MSPGSLAQNQVKPCKRSYKGAAPRASDRHRSWELKLADVQMVELPLTTISLPVPVLGDTGHLRHWRGASISHLLIS